MRFFYVTDLHGDTAKYEKILNIAIKEKVKLIVNGGDMLPKLVDRNEQQPIFINEYLKMYFQRLAENDIHYLTILGNDDLSSLDTMFENVCSEFSNVHYITNNKIEIEGYEFIGMDKILDHPFGSKDRVVMEKDYIFQSQLSPVVSWFNGEYYKKTFTTNWEEYAEENLPDMKDVLEDLPKPYNVSKAIYVMHMPPAYLKLGQLRYQDLDIGSVAITEFIEKMQPLLTLHGHIHEAPETEKGKWINHIGKTTCINTGQKEFNVGSFVYADIDLDKNTFERKVINV